MNRPGDTHGDTFLGMPPPLSPWGAITRPRTRISLAPLIRAFGATAVLGLVALSACSTPAPIAIQSYCEIKATELIDMRDRGIRGLSDANKKAVLAGDDNFTRECRLGERTKSGGPR